MIYEPFYSYSEVYSAEYPNTNIGASILVCIRVILELHLGFLFNP